MDLSDLKGVGAVTEERLSEAGVNALDELAAASVDQLTDSGMSENKAEKLIRRASKQTVVMETGDEVVEKLKQKQYVPSGMDVLDNYLHGGFREGHVVAVSGPSGSGKTQVSFQSLVSAVEATGRPAVYIETEPGRYSPTRLEQLATEDDTQSKIHRVEAHDLEQQELAYEKVKDAYEDGIEYSLIVVDSFTSNFRLSDEFEGRGQLSDRSTVIGRHINGLRDSVKTHGCPCLITAQIYGDPSGYGSPTAIYGGSLFMHSVNYILNMASDRGSLRKTKIMNHPEVAEEEVYVNITDSELESMENV